MDSQTIFVIVLIVAVLAIVVSAAIRRPKTDDSAAPKGEPKAKDGAKPVVRAKALEDRIEVDAPVEISEGMSLAEIKRAKAARIKGDKGRRQTAVEATEEAQREYADAPDEPKVDQAASAPEAAPEVAADDVDAGWDVFDEDEDGDEDVSAPAADPADEPEPAEPVAPAEPAAPEDEPAEEDVEEPVGLDQMSEALGTPLSQGLERTRTGFIHKLGQLFRRGQLDDDLVEDLEEVLYTADIGPRAATAIMSAVEAQLSKDQKADPEVVWKFVRKYVEDLLRSREAKLDIDAHSPFVMLVIGVNGVGKTTTIGKMAAKYKRAGKRVLLVAGDTFRAAAVEQIVVWGERAGIPVHKGDSKADPASVVFSGVQRAKDEGFDIVICDTAGRLHTKAPLLDELEKINRVTQKVIETAPHETILVLDANTGQNAIQQAKMFAEAVPITGIVLTKLDGTAKGGVILGICDELDAPIRFVGIGESVADLRQFDAREFTEALFM